MNSGAPPQDPVAAPGLRALAVLPARLASTRLARKVLLAETGAPLFVHAARNAQSCPAVSQVLVATDDEEVLRAAEEHQLPAVLTDAAHVSGTDRVEEAVRLLGEDFEVVVNVQADEPEVDHGDLTKLVEAFRDPSVQVATLCVPFGPDEDLTSPSAVKVVCDLRGNAMYFSRAAIPSMAHARPSARPRHRRHVGVYAFRPASLTRCCALPPGALEAAENLEQLRWLEAGETIRVLEAHHAPRGIDTRADYDAFVALHAASQLSKPSTDQ